MKQAFIAELLKIRHAKIVWVTFIAFSLAPIMGGVFMLILNDPVAIENAGALSAKAQMMNFSANWNSYLEILTQAVAVGGVLIFGFVASWIFGREYSDDTAKDLLALPTSRIKILNAKYSLYVIWCFVLTVSNLVVGALIGLLLQLPAPTTDLITAHATNYFLTTVLTVIIGTPVAFMAIWSKGYLGPLGFVALALVFSQIIAATGFGYYFPWSVPGLFSGAGGEYKEQLDTYSYLILILTSVLGYIATVSYWRYADQEK
ncbi:ABC transporter permease [Marivirga sp. S37H4]|uniref:ABC transporter permease n=1 Tax=Marivirga aurantiaca TaxID=2802615 RepID=A0A935CBM0_9BACT|nr:ABC transporter permease [Marivirga aurantiaca]MBK6267159.1 ABC transporter permease [Marivirga aurantiaca]